MDKKDKKQQPMRSPLAEETKLWIFSGLIRRMEYFERGAPLIEEQHFHEHEHWLRLVWSVVLAYHKKYAQLPTKKLIITKCNSHLELDPSALTDLDIEKLDEFLTMAFDFEDQDFPEQPFMEGLQQFLEDRLVTGMLISMSRPQMPADLTSALEGYCEKSKAVAATTESYLANLSIVCGSPDRTGWCVFTATYHRKTYQHRFHPHDAVQREKFGVNVARHLNLLPAASKEIESRVLRAFKSGHSGTLNIENLSDIKIEATGWVWHGYIPSGEVTILEGDPEAGKSSIAIDIAARLSRGDAMPPSPPASGQLRPTKTLIISGEDNAAKTTKPRLIAAGALEDNVGVLSSVSVGDGEERFVKLPTDVQLIEEAVQTEHYRFIIMDVLGSITEDGVSCNDDAAMRRLFTALAQMAHRTNVAILVIRHHNKKAGLSAMYRGGGSIAIIGAARSGLVVAAHPTDPAIRVLASVKSNLGSRPQSLTYRLEAAAGASRIVWGEPVELTSDELLGSASKKQSKHALAEEIIRDKLQHGPCREREVFQACKDKDIGEKTYRRARTDLGVISEHDNGFGGRGNWSLSLPSGSRSSSAVSGVGNSAGGLAPSAVSVQPGR